MKGIKKTKRFYNELVKAESQNILKDKFTHLSVAYLGEGSEILGFDDMISSGVIGHKKRFSLCDKLTGCSPV